MMKLNISASKNYRKKHMEIQLQTSLKRRPILESQLTCWYMSAKEKLISELLKIKNKTL